MGPVVMGGPYVQEKPIADNTRHRDGKSDGYFYHSRLQNRNGLVEKKARMFLTLTRPKIHTIVVVKYVANILKNIFKVGQVGPEVITNLHDKEHYTIP